jgi:hypothetical protein
MMRGGVASVGLLAQRRSVSAGLASTSRVCQGLVYSQHRSIVRLVTRDKTLGSFDSRDAPLQPVNPFGLPPKANNAAGRSLSSLGGGVPWRGSPPEE